MSDQAGSFAEVLRQFRTAAALSQEALAERAGLSVRGISDLERGVRRAPYPATVALLADALALDPADRQVLLAAARRGPAKPSSSSAGIAQPSSLPTTNVTVRPALALVPPPIPPTPLVGREHEVAEVCALLRRATCGC